MGFVTRNDLFGMMEDARQQGPTFKPNQYSSPNAASKREKALAIAQKEAEEYAKYKEQRKLQHVHEAPQCTGVSENTKSREQVLQGIENDIKSSKYRTKVRKDLYKEEQRKKEEAEINEKLSKARSQAKKNELKQQKVEEETKLRQIEVARENRLRYFGQSVVNNQTTEGNSKEGLNDHQCSSLSHPIINSSSNSPMLEISALDNDQTPSVGTCPVDPTLIATSNHSSDQDIPTLVSMFPAIDVEVLQDIYVSNGRNVEATILMLSE